MKIVDVYNLTSIERIFKLTFHCDKPFRSSNFDDVNKPNEEPKPQK